MPPKMFHALVVAGASLTGSIGVAVVPAITLPGCSSKSQIFGNVDDMRIVMDAGLVENNDLADSDADSPDGGT